MPDRRPSAWRPHPWHGLSVGPEPPRRIHAYVEITPFDLVKYEIDKATGYLRVDRPQRTSSTPPMLYGFVPRTLCGARVAGLGTDGGRGDDDPLDVCVLSERPIERAEVILDATVVGGIRMLDGGEADDKIIAVLAKDPAWDGCADLSELPKPLIDRLVHYFSTYKTLPGEAARARIDSVYGRDLAYRVVEAAIEDYVEAFPDAATS